ncbi:uncharacterized protein LOC141714203 [Apium graveolens]|uniref:uncharacterized protein LOC141714203 n=1 Tax=Apium graveolens TaxID=4045 RepID=UPI003D7B8617
MDLGFEREMFTWERCRGTDAWVQERLDRGLANQDWKSLFPDAVVKVIEVSTSDHLPLFLDLNRWVYMEKKKMFRFENVWIRESDYYNVIKSCWTEKSNDDIMVRLGRCGVKLEACEGGLVKEMREKIAEC